MAILDNRRYAMTAAAFALHEAAMDAATEPSTETIREVRRAIKAWEKTCSGMYGVINEAVRRRAYEAGELSKP